MAADAARVARGLAIACLMGRENLRRGNVPARKTRGTPRPAAMVRGSASLRARDGYDGRRASSVGGSSVVKDLSGRIRGLLLDIDGTLLVADEPVAGAAELIAALRKKAVPFRVTTNTTRRPRRETSAVLRRGG